jgi:mono/diheme cytochrome c family protein
MNAPRQAKLRVTRGESAKDAMKAQRPAKLRLRRRESVKAVRARFASVLLVWPVKSRRPTLTIVLATVTLLAAFVTAARPEQSSHGRGKHGDSDAWTPPTEAARKTNPLAGRSELAAGGRKLFQQRCAQCHGDDAAGTSLAPDLTRRVVQSQSDGALYWRISGGNAHTGMPSFSYLPELERWQVVLHLRTLPGAPTSALARSPRRP